MNSETRYILLISIHGLIRSKNLELGRDSDTGGQTKYVIELAETLGRNKQINKVDLLTRKIIDSTVDKDYQVPVESISDSVNIVRIKCGENRYIPKEELWDYLDNFVDNALTYLKQQPELPDIIHTHYADAGYVGVRLSNLLGIPLVHTGHSLGRIKRQRLLASGMNQEAIEEKYNITRRITAEEETLAMADLIITSTHQEVKDQYSFYDCYQPNKMQVVPPGTDLKTFSPPVGDEMKSDVFHQISQFLKSPNKPIILALSRLDQRKNVISLVEAYGESEELQDIANLVICTGSRDDIRKLADSPRNVLLNILMAIDRLNLYGKIAYPQKIKSTDLPVLYRLAALSGGVFVNPALTEPFGLTLLEAAASCLPVVATEDGGPIDIIGNCQNGYLIDPLDTEDIAEKILKVLKNPVGRKALAERGLKGVNQFYSWDSHVEKYLKILQPIFTKSDLPEKVTFARPKNLYQSGAIVTGLDHNLIGDTDALQTFLEILKPYHQKITFCIATGRRLDSALRELARYLIPQPEVLITSLGTEIYYSPELTPDTTWKNHIDYLWNPRALQRIMSEVPGLTMQPNLEQSEFKISYFYSADEAPPIEEIKSQLLQNDQTVNVIFSFGQFLDIVPIRASKGYAVRWFIERWGISLENTLTVGVTGADEDLLRGNTLSVVIASQHQNELENLREIEPIYFAKTAFAKGIVEGIEHYDFFQRCQQSISLPQH
jgi:sucrose-phosphate synthase